MNETDHDTVQSAIRQTGRMGTFLESLGFEIVHCADGTSRVELLVDDRHLRNMNMVHGGVTATLLDTAMGIAAHSLAPAGHYSVTAQLDVKYTRPGRAGERLITTGQTQHSGKRTAVVRGECRTHSGDLVATGSATMMYLPYPNDLKPNDR